MAEAKPHIRSLYRTRPEDNEPRRGKLRLDMNESISGLPAAFIRKALSNVTPEYLAAYPEYGKLQEKIAAHNGLRPENICLSNGSDAAIKYIFDAFISPNNKVLITDPTFAMYPIYCKMFGAEAVKVAYGPDLEFPAEDFARRISRGIKMAVMVNPNNPAGTAVDPKDLVAIIEKCVASNVLALVDEAYFYFHPHSIIHAVKNFKNLIVLRTFSKICGMAAARLGYTAACPAIIESLRKVRPTYDVNALACLLGEYILDNTRIIHELTKKSAEGKWFLAKNLSKAGIAHRPGEANFILIDCRGKAAKIKKALAERGVLVAGGFSQPPLKDYIRVTTGDIASMKKFWSHFNAIRERFITA